MKPFNMKTCPVCGFEIVQYTVSINGIEMFGSKSEIDALNYLKKIKVDKISNGYLDAICLNHHPTQIFSKIGKTIYRDE